MVCVFFWFFDYGVGKGVWIDCEVVVSGVFKGGCDIGFWNIGIVEVY